MSQTLRGLVGQSMSGQRPIPTNYSYNFPPGSYSFQPPRAGYWKLVLWGPGAGSATAADTGSSGGYCEITRYLNTAQQVALVVGKGGHGAAGSAATTATLPTGDIVSAGLGAQGVAGAGTATGGDVNIVGSAGIVNGSGNTPTGGGGTGGGATGGVAGGAGAPGVLPFRGGAGGNGSSGSGQAPGGGGGSTGAVDDGGDGMIVAYFVRD